MPEAQFADFGVRFQEAIDFLKGKLPEASPNGNMLAGPVNAKVFTVAGSTSADLSRDLQEALVRGLASGTTITQFRREFDQAVQQYGWTYNGKRGWRTNVIFDANMRSARMAGRWAQIQENKDRRPYLQYRTAGDSRVRRQHRQWNGLIFPVDHPFWLTHYPPCGWGCRCTVRAFSAAEMADLGLSESPPFEIKWRDVRNADGELVDRVPLGIDPGWDHNVGQAWIAPEIALGQKLARLPVALQGLLVGKTITPEFQSVLGERWKAFRSAADGSMQAQETAHVVGFLDADTLQAAATVPGLAVDCSTISAVKPQAAEWLGWPSDWIDELPANLRNYRAQLWDTDARRLIVVPQGSFSDAIPVAVLNPAAVTTFGRTLTVERLATRSAAELRDPRYLLLQGRVQ